MVLTQITIRFAHGIERRDLFVFIQFDGPELFAQINTILRAIQLDVNQSQVEHRILPPLVHDIIVDKKLENRSGLFVFASDFFLHGQFKQKPATPMVDGR